MPTALIVKHPHSPHASSRVGRGSWVQGVGNQWERRSGVREVEEEEEEEEGVEEEGERRPSAGAEAVMEAVVVAEVEAESGVVGGGESGIPAQNSRKTTRRRL